MTSEIRKTIIDRANRILKQSKTLRSLSQQILKEADDLKQEAADIRSAAAGEKATIKKHPLSAPEQASPKKT